MTASGDSQGIHERRAAPKGAVIIKQGDRGNLAYLIQSGKVEIYAEHNGYRTDFAVLGAGQIFGEMALLGEDLRSAYVRALEDTNLIVISRETLNAKLAKSDPTVRAMVPMLIKRIAQTNDERLKKAETIKSYKELVSRMYRNMGAKYPPVKQKTMERLLQPKLEAFLDALTEFEKMNGE